MKSDKIGKIKGIESKKDKKATNSWFFERINKTEKLTVKLTEKKRER